LSGTSATLIFIESYHLKRERRKVYGKSDPPVGMCLRQNVSIHVFERIQDMGSRRTVRVEEFESLSRHES
jgi:hypothetical protein